MITLASTFGRWVAPLFLAGATFCGTLGIASGASADESGPVAGHEDRRDHQERRGERERHGRHHRGDHGRHHGHGRHNRGAHRR